MHGSSLQAEAEEPMESESEESDVGQYISFVIINTFFCNAGLGQ